MRSLSPEEKVRIVQHLRRLKQVNADRIRAKAEAHASRAERRVLRRLNGVSVALRGVKLKDGINVERRGKPTLRDLVREGAKQD